MYDPCVPPGACILRDKRDIPLQSIAVPSHETVCAECLGTRFMSVRSTLLDSQHVVPRICPLMVQAGASWQSQATMYYNEPGAHTAAKSGLKQLRTESNWVCQHGGGGGRKQQAAHLETASGVSGPARRGSTRTLRRRRGSEAPRRRPGGASAGGPPDASERPLVRLAPKPPEVPPAGDDMGFCEGAKEHSLDTSVSRNSIWGRYVCAYQARQSRTIAVSSAFSDSK